MSLKTRKRSLATAVCTGALAALSLAPAAGAATETAPITLTPDRLAFGSVQLGQTSASQTLTLKVPCLAVVTIPGNKFCSAPGSVSAITAEGDFAQTNDCPLPIRNTAVDGTVVTCRITVAFSPTAEGERTGLIGLTSSGIPNAYTAPLAGLGVKPTQPGEKPGGQKPGGKPGDDVPSGSQGAVAGKRCKKAKKKPRRRCRAKRRR